MIGGGLSELSRDPNDEAGVYDADILEMSTLGRGTTGE